MFSHNDTDCKKKEGGKKEQRAVNKKEAQKEWEEMQANDVDKEGFIKVSRRSMTKHTNVRGVADISPVSNAFQALLEI